MRKLAAIVALGAFLIALVPVPAHAGAAGDVVLALGAFALFNALFVAPALARPVYLAPAPVVYSTPAPVYAPAPPATVSREVVYPHGRYVLYGDGVTRAYQWIWVPNAPPPGSAPGY